MADDVARLVAIVEANLKGFQKGMDQAKALADRRFGQIENRLNRTERSFANFGRGLRNAFLGGSALFGLERFVSSVSRAADELSNVSQALGVGTDELQTWGVLATRAGVSQEQFNKSIEGFSQRLGDAQLKGGAFAKFLDGLGVGTSGSAQEVFFRLADAVKATADQQQRAAIVAEAFGAKNVKLVTVLQQGSAELRKQGIEFAKNGQIITRDNIAKIDELGDKWEEFKRQLQVSGANVLGGFAESFSRFSDDLTSPEFQASLRDFGRVLGEISAIAARLAPILPNLLGALAGARLGRIGGAPGAIVGGVIGGLAPELIDGTTQSVEQLEAELQNLKATLSGLPEEAQVFTAAQINQLETQIEQLRAARRTAAQAAGIPFAPSATGAAPTSGGAINRTGALSSESDSAAKKKADIEAQIRQDAFDIQQHFLEQEADAVARAAEIEAEIRQHYAEVQQGLWEREAEDLADFHARANQAWDDYYQRQAEMSQSAYEERLAQADTFFGSLATLTRSSSEELRAIGKAAAIIQATIDGVLAVQKALASAPPPINFALAAAVGAATAANVAQIAAMEHGGRVSAGTPYIVGEKRPEVFVPDSAGRIIPSIPQAMAAGISASGHTINIDARGASPDVVPGITDAIRQYVGGELRIFQRRLPGMMIKAQRDNL